MKTTPTTKADLWRLTNPAKYAEYLAAVELVHSEVFAAARAWLGWLGVEVYVAPSGRLVATQRGREVSAPLRPEAVNDPAALRRQITALVAKLQERGRAGAGAGRWTLTMGQSA